MPWTAGQHLHGGKYEIEEKLGQGGFGITYKALHIELNRTVVIKTPDELLSHDPEYDKYIERFIQEGRTLARLSQDPHPHIVGVIDLFKEGATHCLVMDFVPGENLFEAVRRTGALAEAEIVPCIRQIGEALMIVHQAGLVHRDAHPGNIMLRSNGKAVLIDFGIAKGLVPKTLTSKGYVGNHGFAPYEQIHRGSREPTVDVYCLAATLYYAVTGQKPTTSLARKLDNVPLTPPKRIVPRISNQLNDAIIKGMALEAQDRPQSMQVWLAMLEEPKATPRLPVEPIHRKEVVYSKAKLDLKAIPSKPATKSPKIIPWDWLVGVLLSYLLIGIGYSLCTSNARYIDWALFVAGAVAMAWAVAKSAAKGMGVYKAWAMATSLLFAWIFAYRFVIAPLTGVVLPVPKARAEATIYMFMTAFVAVSVAVAVTGVELQKSFSKVHTFLILASTSNLGLGLGWLGYKIFNKGS
ncbi:MAG: serine/threonine-protein kinase [Nostoc sp.]|uniref:serine/threonine protein kinase n=1 Tax=Nostoc sp. TaxID=1180 RepID=UPI002FF45D70